jgi:Co/Zn/Cd efflux system component
MTAGDVTPHRHGPLVHAHAVAGGRSARHRHALAPWASREVGPGRRRRGAAAATGATTTDRADRADRGQPGTHEHGHSHDDGHGHSHGLVDETITRSRAGLQAVGWSLLLLGLTAAAQGVVYALSGSVALLADLIHNAGDAATALPLAVAFLLRSARAERWAGLAVVAAIFVSACVAGFEAVSRLISPHEPRALGAVALAGAVGFAGNWAAALVRTRAGRRIDSPALIADGAHARADAYVSLAVIASAAVVAIGVPVADPLIGLAITGVILRITLVSWRTVRAGRP